MQRGASFIDIDQGVPATPEDLEASTEAPGPTPAFSLPLFMFIFAIVGFLLLREVWAK